MHALSPPLPHPDPDPDPCQRPLPQARKARSKTRKPKFLSLDRTHSPNPPDSPLHLFPLHPEINQDEPTSSSPNLEDNVAWLLEPEPSFSSEETAMSSLFSGEISGGDCPNQETFDFTETMGGKDLEATALRKRSEEREEKWVFCKPWGDEEVNQGLCLKLDYEEILNAWSDKGSLYIEGEGPQTVPQEQPNGWMDAGMVKLWRVPDDGCSGAEDGVERERGERMEQREARVMRYKEKRQTRLFSKRIRYEVRKLNAEKRPRMKGRFVKRKPDS